ncbi:MAG: hypothetical protein CML50_00350 [Rhodobacteraceae bacterium]|uniref:Uncharacterized protein n=1 Tax=Salipiger profundus TaxID=1229727 RepID=A0A1U7D0V5_9RHOB|nr:MULTISPECIES: hypothetical protein [Salipiger]APX21787.1 hypothetical protein Ga0080559_TMP991 [Salipiger profundus]MAB04458.1 hypothetical protein [Paracoccaceae bacterium]GFZ99904.1 hypothetical protein GCM10011326_08670 [Salipiger profundus]SFC06962.1 hypothetical protein SAMN05444415_10221 [Salipiger profundus]
MQIILHIGVHSTDEDRLLKGLLRNAEDVRKDGVAIPGPGRYRTLLSDTVNALGDGTPAPEAREVLLDAIIDDDPERIDRLVLSHENLLSVPKLALAGGRLYRKLEQRLLAMRRLFPGDDIKIYVGLRDFATFLPAVYAATPHASFDDFLCGADPMRLRWSEMIARIRTAVPSAPVTVWCNEDTPLIWGQLLREMAGIEANRKITGAFDLFAEIISPEGMTRFRAFLTENPGVNEAQKRRVMMAFLEKYALDEAIEEELDLPGWDGAYVDMLTELYDEDVSQIGRMPGVRLISA